MFEKVLLGVFLFAVVAVAVYLVSPSFKKKQRGDKQLTLGREIGFPEEVDPTPPSEGSDLPPAA